VDRQGGSLVYTRRDSPARAFAVAALDVLVWPVAFLLAGFVRDDSLWTEHAVPLAIVAMVLQATLGLATGIYRRRYRPFSFEEAAGLGITLLGTTLAVTLLDHFADTSSPGNIGLGAGYIAAVLMLGHRLLRRLRARIVARRRIAHRQPVVVIGAGEGGFRAISAMLGSPESPYRPVALIDDDPSRQRSVVSGLRVAGTTADLAKVAHRHHAEAALIAIPSADVATLRRIDRQVRSAGLTSLVLPPLHEMLGGRGTVREIHRLSDEELLRRELAAVDMDAVRRLIAGKRVLVTGAGGSIGSELARQVASWEPATLLAVDHDDSLLHALQRSIPAGDLEACQFVLADVRDAERVHELMDSFRPELVFHAAALKHLPALEQAPEEGWKTNVVGTHQVLAAAERAGVAQLVNISTDKAADPSSVLGLTKRIAERLTSDAAQRLGRPYVSVRFGNVLGSRGSAIETFEAQIRAGGPVTVTHPDVTRYFMATGEAVRLTLQAATIGRPGEVLVLDMGQPVKIVELAHQLIEQAGGGVDIEFIGLRPGEKLHEVLLSADESSARPFHPLIDHVWVPRLDWATALEALGGTAPRTKDSIRRVAEWGLEDRSAPRADSGDGREVTFGEVSTAAGGPA
jgi:FlaA1/EpsC-like NDP-sugar epimerase